ncbi:IS30 family transposase [Streptomonospora sp. S1-112]|uniref:IS30 family transposase n=2 Tax=Streptomonospora mangrovi TaxID=2883123 RepID=A0A9X3SK55_9ACTN|nr:IS30 family transposase [Streptomonospora mangrovi]MDA0568094.1 IS30 family transposase [Streptomonospora mangrovi]
MPGRRLSVAEREEIAVGIAAGESIAEIAQRIGRHRSTLYRELDRNLAGNPRPYRATAAHAQAGARAKRPKPRRLAPGTALRGRVAELLAQGWSPQQVAGRLKADHPHDGEMRVSHETIYQALFVQGRGGLREELKRSRIPVRCPARRTRRPRGRAQAPGRLSGMVHISSRPVEAHDRAVPGHWEGDLLIGARGASAIAVLAERASRFVLLVGVADRRAETVAQALARRVAALPEALKGSLTWDQGTEMARHADFSVATQVPVFFCDPHSPWQRGTNENTNGLLRYYFPKGVTDFTRVERAELDRVEGLLNTRPRKTLGYRTPAEKLDELLVATTH